MGGPCIRNTSVDVEVVGIEYTHTLGIVPFLDEMIL